MIQKLLSLLLLSLTATTLAAQDSAKPSKITFSVVRCDPREDPSSDFIIKNGSKETALSVPLSHIAGPFTATLREGKHLDFFKPGETDPVVSTEISLEKNKDLLLVFVPVNDSFEIIPITMPFAQIKGGDHYVINTTHSEVLIEYSATAPVTIAARQSAMLHDPKAGKALTLPIAIKQKIGEEWKPVTTENWPHDKRFRTFLFLYQSDRDQHMSFHGITQRVD